MAREIDPADAEPAGGLSSVTTALGRAVSQMGLRRSSEALSLLNQQHGFDCPSCAWPEPDGTRTGSPLPVTSLMSSR